MNPVKVINGLLQKSCSIGSDESSWKIHFKETHRKKSLLAWSFKQNYVSLKG